jgi:hypothetical protein
VKPDLKPAAMKHLALEAAKKLRASLQRQARSWSFPRLRWQRGVGALGWYAVCAIGERASFGIWVDRLKPGGRRTPLMLAVGITLLNETGVPSALARRARRSRMNYGAGEKTGIRENAYGDRTVVETDESGHAYVTRYWKTPPDAANASKESRAFFDRWHKIAEDFAAYTWPPINRGSLASRRRARTAVLRRRGQAAFRAAMLKAYGGKCAISACTVRDVLEAAHIEGYADGNTHAVRNGLLLRSDLHNLFDLGFLAIDPEDMTVVLFGSLAKTEYGRYEGKEIAIPKADSATPDYRKLAEHLAWCRQRAGT